MLFLRQTECSLGISELNFSPLYLGSCLSLGLHCTEGTPRPRQHLIGAGLQFQRFIIIMASIAASRQTMVLEKKLRVLHLVSKAARRRLSSKQLGGGSQSPPLLLDAFSRPARKNTTDQNLLRQSFILTSSGKESKKQEREKQEKEKSKQESEKARERARDKRERERNPVPLKEHSPSPRTCHSLIGCSPSAELTSRGRQSTSSHKIPLAHAQIICLPLRTQDVSAIL